MSGFLLLLLSKKSYLKSPAENERSHGVKSFEGVFVRDMNFGAV